MYLLREFNLLSFIVLCLLWGVGGWLMLIRTFDVPERERSLLGFGIGLVISNWLVNFLARLLPFSAACWLSAGLTLAGGIALAWPLEKEYPRRLLQNWRQWLLVAVLTFLFTLIGRGLSIYDDFQNLPMTSLIATGEVPPNFPLASNMKYGYHYFLLLLAAQFLQVAQAAPWTAVDLARGLVLALTLALGGLWAWRLTGQRLSAVLAGLFMAFAGGLRWALFLLPPSLLEKMSAQVTLIGSAASSAPTLKDLLTSIWLTSASPGIPFPAAFVSGVDEPFVMLHNGYGASHLLLILLMLMLGNWGKRVWPWGMIMAVLFASLALANEAAFALIFFGGVLAILLWLMLYGRREKKAVLPIPLLATAIGAGVLTLFQGGFITNAIAGWLKPTDSVLRVEFALIPPALLSAHLGSLNLFELSGLTAALVEAGLVIFAIPWVLAWGWKAIRDRQWFAAAVSGSTLFGILSVFIRYTGGAGETATTRLFVHSLQVAKILAVPLMWNWLTNKRNYLREITIVAAITACLSGFVLFGVEVSAMQKPVYADYLTSLDAQFYAKYWNKLEPGALVFDPRPSRAPTIFGRYNNAATWWINSATEEWLTLMQNPEPHAVRKAGYSYMYYHRLFWEEHQGALDQECARLVEQIDDIHSASNSPGDFRRLVDIRGCQ